MAMIETTSAGRTVALTDEERTQLVQVLEQVLRDTKVEAHRTDNPDYRGWIERREAVLSGVLEKLRQP